MVGSATSDAPPVAMLLLSLWLPYSLAQEMSPSVATSAELDPRLDLLDHLLSQTIYRVVQEAVTNVIKHAHATTLSVVTAMRDQAVTIEVSDDGIGFPDNVSLGRGLTGMSDRSRALDGRLDVLREGRVFWRGRCEERRDEAIQPFWIAPLRLTMARSTGTHQCPLTSTGTLVAGGVLRLRWVRTMPSMMVMPMPGKSPS
jgi:hypothetical protein